MHDTHASFTAKKIHGERQGLMEHEIFYLAALRKMRCPLIKRSLN